jgi:hypothetical protein
MTKSGKMSLEIEGKVYTFATDCSVGDFIDRLGIPPVEKDYETMNAYQKERMNWNYNFLSFMSIEPALSIKEVRDLPSKIGMYLFRKVHAEYNRIFYDDKELALLKAPKKDLEPEPEEPEEKKS